MRLNCFSRGEGTLALHLNHCTDVVKADASCAFSYGLSHLFSSPYRGFWCFN